MKYASPDQVNEYHNCKKLAIDFETKIFKKMVPILKPKYKSDTVSIVILLLSDLTQEELILLSENRDSLISIAELYKTKRLKHFYSVSIVLYNEFIYWQVGINWKKTKLKSKNHFWHEIIEINNKEITQLTEDVSFKKGLYNYFLSFLKEQLDYGSLNNWKSHSNAHPNQFCSFFTKHKLTSFFWKK